MTVDWTWLQVWLLLVLGWGLYWWLRLQWLRSARAVEGKPKRERTLKPSSPDKCDACRREAQQLASTSTPSPTVRP